MTRLPVHSFCAILRVSSLFFLLILGVVFVYLLVDSLRRTATNQCAEASRDSAHRSITTRYVSHNDSTAPHSPPPWL